MKTAKWNWALYAAFFCCVLFGYTSIGFAETNTVPERAKEIYMLNVIGAAFCALILPFLLPLRDLRAGRRPARYKLRIALAFLVFIPNIIVRIMGPHVWAVSPVNYRLMALGNGATMVLVYGLFHTLAVKNRCFWALLPFSIGLCVYHFGRGPGQYILPSHIDGILFYGSGAVLVMSGIFTFMYLANLPTSLKAMPAPLATHAQLAPYSTNAYSINWVFPILAGFIVFLLNTFTSRMFVPLIHSPFKPGFSFPAVAAIIALPLFGLLADYAWRRFLMIFTFTFPALMMLSPAMLFLGNSQSLFMVLYTLIMISLIVFQILVIFTLVDIYWRLSHRRTRWDYCSWFLGAIFNMIRLLVQAQAGLFRQIQLDNAYAILLLSLAGMVFFALMWKGLNPLWRNVLTVSAVQTLPDAQAAEEFSVKPDVNLDDIFSGYNLSKREKEVALLMANEGLGDKEMGKRLFISPRTVRDHVSSIYQKFDVKSRAEFSSFVLRKSNETCD